MFFCKKKYVVNYFFVYSPRAHRSSPSTAHRDDDRHRRHHRSRSRSRHRRSRSADKRHKSHTRDKRRSRSVVYVHVMTSTNKYASQYFDRHWKLSIESVTFLGSIVSGVYRSRDRRHRSRSRDRHSRHRHHRASSRSRSRDRNSRRSRSRDRHHNSSSSRHHRSERENSFDRDLQRERDRQRKERDRHARWRHPSAWWLNRVTSAIVFAARHVYYTDAPTYSLWVAF